MIVTRRLIRTDPLGFFFNTQVFRKITAIFFFQKRFKP